MTVPEPPAKAELKTPATMIAQLLPRVRRAACTQFNEIADFVHA